MLLHIYNHNSKIAPQIGQNYVMLKDKLLMGVPDSVVIQQTRLSLIRLELINSNQQEYPICKNYRIGVGLAPV